jgi:ribosomal protein S18 acetylase RimI-like enzyme
MTSIEIKEILSAEIEQYKMFLAAALLSDEESLLITAKDNAGAAFPTKDRNDSFTLGAYAGNVLAGVVSFTRDGEEREKLRHKGLISTMYVSAAFRGHGIAKRLLEELIKRVRTIPGIEQINLIVISSNSKAKQLYEKFGFKRFGTEENSIKWKDKYFSEDLMVLPVQNVNRTTGHDKSEIDSLTKIFFGIFTNTNQQQPDWSIISTVCIPETTIIKKLGRTEAVYNLQSFIEPRKKILSDGTLTQFEESETEEDTKITGNIAQRYSKYKKTGYLNGIYFKEYGNKFFQFIKTANGWKINSVIWEDENM